MNGEALYRLASRGLPRLPLGLNVWIQRRGRRPLPGRRQRAGLRVEARTAGGVRIVTLSPACSDGRVLVYVHGGSYVTGPVPGQWRWLAALATELSMAAVLIDYRLAPEHPHPAALQDVLAALRSLQGDGVLRPGCWALAGDSVGGTLALVAAQTLVAGGEPLPAALVLTAPWVDLTLSNPLIPGTEPSDPVLSRAFLRPSAAAYAGRTPLDDPLLSPLHGDLVGLPPVHLDAGTRDILVHDVRLLHARLLDAGVPVDHVEEPGGLHAFPTLGASAAADRAVAAQAAFVRGQLAPDGPLGPVTPEEMRCRE